MEMTLAKEGLQGYSIQHRPRMLATTWSLMRSSLKLCEMFTRRTAAGQKRAIQALKAAEPSLTWCIGS